jgi:hypothetical protein
LLGSAVATATAAAWLLLLLLRPALCWLRIRLLLLWLLLMAAVCHWVWRCCFPGLLVLVLLLLLPLLRYSWIVLLLSIGQSRVPNWTLLHCTIAIAAIW